MLSPGESCLKIDTENSSEALCGLDDPCKLSLNDLKSRSEDSSTLVKSPSVEFTSHFVIRKNAQSSEGDCEGPPVTRPFTAAPSFSYLQGNPSDERVEEACPNSFVQSRPSTAISRTRARHPFLKSPLTHGIASPDSGRLSGESPRTKLLCMPESPMDNTYQPLYMYCLRKCEVDKGNMQRDEGGATSKNPFAKILEVCGQKCPIPIDVIFNGIQSVEKIGEGVYGEVYSGTFRYFGQRSWVYKVVPIQGSTLINGEKQKTFEEVFPEIIVSQELSKLRAGFNRCCTNGYVHLRNSRVAKGKYPKVLLESWDKFNDKYESDNERPDVFDSDQLHVVFEFEFGGGDIESVQFTDARQTLCIVLQVAHILGVGECALEFEHRDLHWGNVLIEKCEIPTTSYIIGGQTCHVPTMGIKAVVIDFTISRIKDSKGNCSVFLDLREDQEQFLGRGDHQFDIYRMMRDYNRNEWEQYRPKTNIFWLHYLAKKLFTKARYSTDVASKGSVHGKAIRKLKDFSQLILEYESASEFVLSHHCTHLCNFLVASLGVSSTSSSATTMTREQI